MLSAQTSHWPCHPSAAVAARFAVIRCSRKFWAGSNSQIAGLCGPVQVRQLPTQHLFAGAAAAVWLYSICRQSSHSNRSTPNRIMAKLLPYHAEFRIDVSGAKWFFRICFIIPLKSFRRWVEALKRERHRDKRLFKVALRVFDVALDSVGLFTGIDINSTPVFSAHFMLRRAGVGAQMHVDQDIQGDDFRVKRHDNSFGKAVMWRKGFYEPLRHVADAPKRLEDRFSAPVTPTTKTYLHLAQWTSLTTSSRPLKEQVSPAVLPSSAL